VTLEHMEFGAAGRPKVLLLHGFPDTPHSFAPLGEIVADAGYRVIAPWMRGYRPSVGEGPYHAEKLGRDVIELGRAVSPDQPCIVIGHDWGAIATYAALALAPDRFRAAVALSVPHPLAFRNNMPRSPAQLFRSRYMAVLAAPVLGELASTRRDYAMIDRLWRCWSPNYQLPSAHRQHVITCLKQSMPAPILYYRALPQTMVFAARSMRKISVPVLYLHGETDGCVSPDMARDQIRFVDSLETRTLPRVGHFMHAEDPDRVGKLIVEFLGRAPAGTLRSGRCAEHVRVEDGGARSCIRAGL